MVTLEIVIPRKPLLTEAKQTLVLNGDNFQCYLLYRQYFSYFTECSFDISSLYVCFQNNTGKVNICSHIPYFIYSNAQMRQVKLIIIIINNNFYYLEYHPSSSNINRCKVHHVLWRKIIFQQVILIFINCFSYNQNQLFHMKV